MIKNLADLDFVKEQIQKKKNEKVTIKVSMATCGITAGADTVYEYFCDELPTSTVDYEVISTGCMGLCHSEPTIEIKKPGKETQEEEEEEEEEEEKRKRKR